MWLTLAACRTAAHYDHVQETLGFQFWRSGYWKNHLRGQNYHISALYVVDLVRFRQIAAGDQLRAIYDQLSRDPNSLSNLDQDLPNYAQAMIPIHSLPIEWLWCESWCSDASKAAAKTIDLCNNPLHKVRAPRPPRPATAVCGASQVARSRIANSAGAEA